MDTPKPPHRVSDALRFLSILNELAAECAAVGGLTDELTTRRRQRDDGAPAALHREPRAQSGGS